MTSDRLQLSHSALYRIVVQGCIRQADNCLLEEFTIAEDTAQGRTTFEGLVADQAALHGVLARIRDLGLPLLTVAYVPNSQE